MLISTLVIDRRDEWVPFLPKTTQTFPEEITKRTACRLCTPSWSWSSRPPLQVAKNNHKVRSEVCKVQTSFTIDLKFPQKGKTFLCNVSDLLKSGYSEHKNHLHPCTAEMKPIDASMVVTKQSPADSQVWNTAYNVMFFLEFLIVVCYSLEDVKKMTVEPIDKPSGGSRGPWGAVPLAPKIFLKSCSFQAILREKPLFWANCGLRAPHRVKTPLAPLTKFLDPRLKPMVANTQGPIIILAGRSQACSRWSFPEIFVVVCNSLEDGSSPLLMGYPGGGFVLLNSTDLNIYSSCCEEGMMCDQFYTKRPSDTCERYQAPRMGKYLCWNFFWKHN